MTETRQARPSINHDFVIAPERRAELQQLFREFVNSYPFTSQGERHLLRTEAERGAARARYDELLAARQRGEDVTERALLHLLPYANTAANRARGAWIFHSAILTNDIRQWGQRGAASAIDWSAFAAALVAFVARCVADPAQLLAACAEFARQAPARGFQTGMLTPILNALRPNAFFLMNAAARRVVNYFAQTAYSLRLADYPSANVTAGHLFAAIDPDLYNQRLPQLPATVIFAMFAHWLVTIKRWQARSARVWRVAVAADGAQVAADALTLPPLGVGDVAQLSHAEFTARQAALVAEHPTWDGWLRALWTFAHDVREGDALVVNQGTRAVIGVGTVAGPYHYVAADGAAHRLPVDWQSRATLAVNKPGWRKPFGQVDAATFAALRAQLPSMSTPLSGSPAPTLIAEPAAAYHTQPPIPENLSIDAATFAQWAEAIDRKGQAIIYGPPGTGKTFLAERLARHLVGAGDGFVEIVQFHPAYTYEDFIQGIRPQSAADGQLSYPLVPGRFLEFCRRAEGVTGRCVLIIDEINRANLAQVFGELMYLLEYRDRSMPLAGGGMLRIPTNARIIGTMNTADRSIALVDHALRRRFAFLALTPNYDVLRHFHATTAFPVANLIAVLQRLNQAIDDPNYALGISYFLRLDLAAQLSDIWRMEIEPYIEEYFFDQPATIAAFRWDAIASQILP